MPPLPTSSHNLSPIFFFLSVLQSVPKFLSSSDRLPFALQDGIANPSLQLPLPSLQESIMATDHPSSSPSSGLAGLPALFWEIAGSYVGIIDRFASAGQCEQPQASYLSSIPFASRFHTSARLTRLKTFSPQSTAASATATPRCSGTSATSPSPGGSRMLVSDDRPAATSVYANGPPTADCFPAVSVVYSLFFLLLSSPSR